ncbi:hypothetical protein CTI14_05705 [Methylobacterium radiotolerans]|nr:hypothetical protein CTI14_05705 [Methylobacterium radiotolerans]
MNDTARAALQRIAQTLGISEEMFLGARDAGPSVAAEHRLSEELELLRVYQTIEDPDTRLVCLAFVRDAAGAIKGA